MTFDQVRTRLLELAADDATHSFDRLYVRHSLRHLADQLAEAVRAEAVPPPPGKSWLGRDQAARLLDLLRAMPEGSSITITR
jgi:hypothetical protein